MATAQVIIAALALLIGLWARIEVARAKHKADAALEVAKRAEELATERKRGQDEGRAERNST